MKKKAVIKNLVQFLIAMTVLISAAINLYMSLHMPEDKSEE